MSQTSEQKIISCLRTEYPIDLSIGEITAKTGIHRNTVSKYVWGLKRRQSEDFQEYWQGKNVYDKQEVKRLQQMIGENAAEKAGARWSLSMVTDIIFLYSEAVDKNDGWILK